MPTADLIIVNADVHTMDLGRPRASAIAIKGDRILAVGSLDDIRVFADGGTRKMDVGGRLVLPGFQDTHIHLQDSGVDHVLGCDLAGSTAAALAISASSSSTGESLRLLNNRIASVAER